MSGLSIKDQLKKLRELQELDSEIYHHRIELKEKPLYIAQLKEQFETKKTRLKELEEKLKVLQVDRNSKEVELKGQEDEITKANAQLSQLKTNKEYQAKIAEIEHHKADKSILEEKILEDFDKVDTLNSEITQEKNALAEEEKRYLAQKKEVDDTVRELEDKVKVLENKREQVIPEVDQKILYRYELVLKNKDGLALVSVRNNSCGGCYMNVPDQVINEMKMYEHIISCQMCSRILYLEEDL